MVKKGIEIGLILLLIVLAWVDFIIEVSLFPIAVFLISFILLIVAVPIKEEKKEEEKQPKKIIKKEPPVSNEAEVSEDVPIINFPNNFDEDKFLEDTFELYKNIQEYFMDFKYDELMSKLGFEMYGQFAKQMKSLQGRGKQSIRTNIVLDKIEIASFIQHGEYHIATVNLVVLEDKYMKGIKDDMRITSSGVRYESGYALTIVKRHKKKIVKKCHNCHEKLNGSPFKCPKCNAMLIETNENWIMTDLKLLGSHSKKES